MKKPSKPPEQTSLPVAESSIGSDADLNEMPSPLRWARMEK
jgi:hypothetical protein